MTARATGERIDRTRTVTFTFDGKPVQAFAGDTIASALYASGRRIFSRSFKYHRPRGEMDWAGHGSGSLMQVDGKPGIRAASEVVRDGHARRAPERVAVAGPRRHAHHRHRGRPVHAAGLLLQDVQVAAARLAALRARAAQRRRARPAAPPPGGARVAHGVPPAPLRRAGHRRRDRRAVGRAGRGTPGRRRGARRRRRRAGRRAARRGRPRAGARARGGGARGGRRGARRTRPRSATTTGSCRCGRATRCTKSGPRATSRRRARSSSRSSSRTTTCPA